jgi:hypothetical protein
MSCVGRVAVVAVSIAVEARRPLWERLQSRCSCLFEFAPCRAFGARAPPAFGSRSTSRPPCRSSLAGDVFVAWLMVQSEELSSSFGGRVTFLLRGQEKSNQKRRPPRLALAGLLPGKSVSRGRAFRQGILPWRKGIGIHADARCAACRPRLTAAQGPRVEQRAILVRTRYATAARLRELEALGAGWIFRLG